MANRLASETSPYLRQHAGNPVDWYPWGDEALDRAKAEDRPIFLSVGYAACHWCHVMAHESFEDPAVAAVLNEHFVSIKVDREERPDIDHIYMSAVQMLTGQGGWPMSVFLSPDGRPFYGGTYFPPSAQGGMPSFTQVLTAVLDAWQNRRSELLSAGQQVTDTIARQRDLADGEERAEPNTATLASAFEGLSKGYDDRRGGWGGGPKFPQPTVLEFLLRFHRRTTDPRALQMVRQALREMARGGIYDQLGGGFHRYSVDDRWLVPHFEKMLYDNALLAPVYLHAWQLTGEELFRAVAEETLDFLLREMSDPAGGFYSTLDADSEGKEGKFYVWTPDEVRAVLGADAEPFLAAYGVTEAGNFEGKNILTFAGKFEDRQTLAPARAKLLEARERRVRPGRDEKVLASWNGLALAAFAEAARVLGRQDYLDAAIRNAEFLLGQMRTPEGRLRHSWKDSHARIEGYLEDYADVAHGVIELYESTFDPRWYVAAKDLVGVMTAHFAAAAGFYDTPDDGQALIVRPREIEEGATPSGNGMAATVLFRLAGLAVQPDWTDTARKSLAQVAPFLAQYPIAFGQWLATLEYAVCHPREVAVVGDLASPEALGLLKVLRSGYHPERIVAAGAPTAAMPEVELLQDRELVDGRAAAYVCVDYTCLPPVTEPAELEELLK